MKKKIIIFIILLIIIIIPITIKITNKSDNTNPKLDTKENLKEGEIIDEYKENNKSNEKKSEEVKRNDNFDESTDNKKVEKNISSKKETSNSSNTINNNSTRESKMQEVEVNIEIPKTKTEDTKHYIDVPDPNSYYYSFHHGHIDFSSLDECHNNSDKYLSKDVNDIYGSWCMEVQDENGKVLGAYLYIKCTSGNCDKYKGY